MPWKCGKERAMTKADDRIRERAYRLWELEGRPDGRALAHWGMAEKLITAEDHQISGPDPDPVPALKATRRQAAE
jgi:hypothetical protein